MQAETLSKRTQGPVTVYSRGYDGARVEVMAAPCKERQFSIALMTDGDDATLKANAEFIAEAFNVATETGMTPRQLADWQHDTVIFLKAIQPDLDRLATAEARANQAPTGQPKRTAHQDRARWCRAAASKAEGRQ